MNNEIPKKKKSLWNKDYLLLWQGNLVSAVGNVAYSVALGFWILMKTGSTALMGTVMAATSLPVILFGPIAGVLIDRSNRKWILVITDFIRGVAICWCAYYVFTGKAEIWMIFTAGVISGICTSFFDPTVSSTLPDLVEKEDIEKANSFFSMIQAGSGILGNAGGGAMFAILGAPLMFLINGLSYLFSAFTELFIKVPKIERKSDAHFKADLKEGFSFTWNYTGLRILILTFAAVNFFANIVLILILPLYQQTESLGPVKYGITMAGLFTGSLIGMIIISSMKITYENRYKLFAMSALLMAAFFAIFPVFNNFYIMTIFFALGGLFNAIMNVLVNSVIQQTVPQEKRGKVFGLLVTITSGLTPVAMAIGGILAEFFPIKMIIVTSLVFVFLLVVTVCLNKEIKKIFSFDKEPLREAV